MKKFESIIEKYQERGVRIDNIEYAIESVKHGAKRDHILENLSADYRGMNLTDANGLLNELFAANGGEFKKENRGGYLYGIFCLMLGLSLGYYFYYVFTYGGRIRPITVLGGAIAFTFLGLVLTTKALLGKYRDSDEPFKD
ncbi:MULTISPECIES: hypothetical protein [Niastella]|uniref:Uncharacterized protein n=1 Tax=Niastella soli TaxID=2821487 RepID=A0ABS3Z194_9BACT|nr:hypothetical protein [Niastella soli]MBO9203874.1 hypothetical protein [Niastella soli]